MHQAPLSRLSSIVDHYVDGGPLKGQVGRIMCCSELPKSTSTELNDGFPVQSCISRICPEGVF